MPERMRVEGFIAALVGGDYVWALTEFYCNPAGENPSHEPASFGGGDALSSYRRRTQQPAVHTYLIDGDNVVIHLIHDLLDEQGQPCCVHQLLLQRWVADRIAEERHFYERVRPALAASQVSRRRRMSSGVVELLVMAENSILVESDATLRGEVSGDARIGGDPVVQRQ